MPKNEVPIKVTVEIQGQKYGLIVTHDMSGLGFDSAPAYKAGGEVAVLVARTIVQHFAPQHNEIPSHGRV